MLYWTCPTERATCGNLDTLLPDKDGERGVLVPGEKYSSNFKSGNICTYKIVFPSIAGPTDQLNIKVRSLLRTDLYVTAASRFNDETVENKKIDVNELFDAKYPNNIYLTMVAKSSTGAGYFEIEYKYIDNDPSDQEIADELASGDITVIQETEYVYEEVPFVGSLNFYFVIGAAAIAIILVIVLVICLRRMRKQNDQIMSTVTKLQNEKKTLAEEI